MSIRLLFKRTSLSRPLGFWVGEVEADGRLLGLRLAAGVEVKLEDEGGLVGELGREAVGQGRGSMPGVQKASWPGSNWPGGPEPLAKLLPSDLVEFRSATRSGNVVSTA